MLRHWVRRDSRGCVDDGVWVFDGDDVEERADCVRMVSGRPGAEGAPRSVVCDLDVGWEADGAMRRACVEFC